MGSHCSCQVKCKSIIVHEDIIGNDSQQIITNQQNNLEIEELTKQPTFQQIILFGDIAIDLDLLRLEEELEFYKEPSPQMMEKDPSTKKITDTTKSLAEEKNLPKNLIPFKKNVQKVTMCYDIEYLLRGDLQGSKHRYSEKSYLAFQKQSNPLQEKKGTYTKFNSPLIRMQKDQSLLQSQKSPQSLRQTLTPRSILKQTNRSKGRDDSINSIASSVKRVSFDNRSVKNYNRKSKSKNKLIN